MNIAMICDTGILAVGSLELIRCTQSRAHGLTGMSPYPNPQHMDFRFRLYSHSPCFCVMPKLDFPNFSVDNPRLWEVHFEIYFEVPAINDSLTP
jgi:hypothetical protein